MTFYLYSGAGNTFVVLDGREIISEMEAGAPEQEHCKCHEDADGECGCRGGEEHHCRHEHPAEAEHHCCGHHGGGCCHGGGQGGWTGYVQDVCDHFKTDGLMLLMPSDHFDFEMAFFNPDGTGGMMCGNGGRCIVAFADYLGIKPKDGKVYHFVAGDGPHTGEILDDDGVIKTVRIRMVDVSAFCPVLDGWFVDTGTRHFVKFVPEVEGLDVAAEGKKYRWDPVFAPIGSNANFVKIEPGRLVVRTFEKGVEGETLACGTGITASCIAAYCHSISNPLHPQGTVGRTPQTPCLDSFPFEETPDGRVIVKVRAREDDLQVEFRPVYTGDGPAGGADYPAADSVATLAGFTDVLLTGPAKMFGKE